MDQIAVLDFGGQYAHLIANRIRRLGVYSEIHDAETPAEELKKYKGIIFSGGPQSVYDYNSPQCDRKILDLGIPILGICYGHQLLVHMLGTKVVSGNVKEFGAATLTVAKPEGLFKGLKPVEQVWMSHGDQVETLPADFEVIGSTPDCNYAAIANFKKNIYGTQFHLEVTHTPAGMTMLDNFVNLCGVKREWKIADYIAQEIDLIKQKVGDKKVFMMMSGGIDSTVAFAMLLKALGSEKLYGLYVDTGFMRKDESTQVREIFKKLGFENMMIRDESERFFAALKGKYDPEAKRKIIGDLFIKVQEVVSEELNLNPDEWLLGQGTIYPDTIETGGTKHAAKIKTHHNRVPKIQELMLQGKIIEPICQLYKDEVREVGRSLGLPEKVILRHPFPGPGLAVRCLCAMEALFPEQQGYLEKTIEKILKPYNLTAKILPIQSVGVQGDFRTYAHPLAIMGDCDLETVGKLATSLINQFKEINRVVWLVQPQKIEKMIVHAKDLEPQRIKLLQDADAVVNTFMFENGIYDKIWQFPTVLIPIGINNEIGESIVLRPVSSEEAMTANFYSMDPRLLKELAYKICAIKGLTAVFYDVTNKPPGTIEWE